MTGSARAVLAGVFLWAAVARLLDWHGAVTSIRDYRIAPAGLVHPVAVAVPAVELAVAATLVMNRANRTSTRIVAAVAATVLAAFVAATGSAWARGLPLPCGCPSGEVRGAGAYLWVLVRDGALVLVAVALMVMPSVAQGAASPST